MNDDGLLVVFVAGMLVGAILCWFMTYSIVNSEWEAAAIEHHAAQYNPATGEFEWLKEEP